jgi:hypothetical protein
MFLHVIITLQTQFFMSFRTFSRLLVNILFPLASLCSIYLYLYPLFHGCAFPITTGSRATAQLSAFTQHWPLITLLGKGQEHSIPPYRLLVLADPQLEGDSSLPDAEDGFLRRLDRHRERVFTPHQRKSQRKASIKAALKEILAADIPDLLQGVRKRLDLFGNDYYLAHIFRTLHWWTRPTHVAVLGDLLGSQWVTDEEYEVRAWRFWERVFAGGQRVEEELTTNSIKESKLRGRETSGWKSRIINVAGNHDIGYAGDVSKARIARFEKYFGRADWDTRFTLPISGVATNSSITPSLHVIVLNDLVLDTPALDPDIQSASYDHLNSIITQSSLPVEDKGSFTLLLTHVPLYKSEGVCVDAPFFDFHASDDPDGEYKSGGLKEQNHLSDHVSRSGILEGIFGMTANRQAAGNGKGRKGLVLTGHDHEGCDVWHYIPDNTVRPEDGENNQALPPNGWNSVPWHDANTTASHTGVREITLRSMMGEFGGNAGLLSLWFDFDKGEWQYEIQMCQLGIQHIWWGIHALDCITVLTTLVWLISSYLGGSSLQSTNTDTKLKHTKHENGEATAGKKRA